MKLKQVYIAYDGKDHPEPDGFRFCPRCATELVTREIERRPRSICPGCGYIHFRNPFPVVSLLILREGRVLLGKRGGDPGKGKWATPSGYIEYEDDFLTTAIREAKEETGLDIELKAVLSVMSSFLSPGCHFFSVYLLADVIGGTLAARDDLEAVSWFPLAGPLPELAFQEDTDILDALSKGSWERLPVDPDFSRAVEPQTRCGAGSQGARQS